MSTSGKNDISGSGQVRRDQIRPVRAAGWKAQFAHPSGLGGRMAGWLMGRKNAYIHDLLVEMIAPGPGDRILEIGFGGGTLVRKLSRAAPGARVAGIDASGTMVAQASRLNRRAIEAGRVELRAAGVSAIPFPDGSFDKVCEANTIHHWPDPRRDLLEVRRVMRDGGLLALALRMKASTPGRLQAPGHDEDGISRIARLVEEAGFRKVELERRRLAREVVCLLARR